MNKMILKGPITYMLESHITFFFIIMKYHVFLSVIIIIIIIIISVYFYRMEIDTYARTFCME